MADNNKNPNEKQPGEKPEGTDPYNPGNQAGKGPVRREDSEHANDTNATGA
jgi:hypothetical protein